MANGRQGGPQDPQDPPNPQQDNPQQQNPQNPVVPDGQPNPAPQNPDPGAQPNPRPGAQANDQPNPQAVDAAKAERQEKERLKRAAEEARYNQMDYWAKYYRETRLEQASREISVKRLGEPENIPGDNLLTTLTAKLEPGAYDVMVKHGKLGEQKESYHVTVNISASGEVKPDPLTVEGWAAAIDMIIEGQRATSIELTVSDKPNNPADAANTLMMWSKMCIDRGVAIDFSKKANAFLESGACDAKMKMQIYELQKISNVRRMESKMESEGVLLDREVKKLGDQTKLQAAIDNIPANDADRETKITAEKWKNFQERLKAAEAVHDRLANLDESDKKLMGQAELLAKADNIEGSTIKYDAEKGKARKVFDKVANSTTPEYLLKEKETKSIGEKVLANMQKPVSAEDVEKRLIEIESKDKLNASRNAAINASRAEIDKLRQLRNELEPELRAKPEKFANEIAQLETVNQKLGAADSPGTLMENNDARKNWLKKDGGREAKRKELVAEKAVPAPRPV